MKFDLNDHWFASGKTLESFEETIEEIAKATSFVKVNPEKVSFYYKTGETPDKYDIIVFNKENLDEISLAAADAAASSSAYITCENAVGHLKKALIDKTLTEESFTTNGFLLNAEGRGYYISENARPTLLMRAGLGGEMAGNKSLILTAAIAEAITKQKRAMTMVVKQIGAVRKVFAVMSDKYEDISQTLLPDIAHQLIDKKTMGDAEVKEWYVDHTFTHIYMEFPQVADDYTTVFGLEEGFIPGLTIMSSDTGNSSLIVRGTIKAPKARGYVVLNEYSHKHSGRISTDDILKAIKSDIHSAFAEFPEALAKKMGNVIGEGKVVTAKDRSDNEKAVRAAIKKGMKELDLRKALGIQRANAILNDLYAEINPTEVYTEYDIADIFMRLPERIEGMSREMVARIAKLCGRAPVTDFRPGAKDMADEVVLLPA